jgi:hypothetical protein
LRTLTRAVAQQLIGAACPKQPAHDVAVLERSSAEWRVEGDEAAVSYRRSPTCFGQTKFYSGKSRPATWGLANYRCGADPVVRVCVIPSLSKNCIAMSAQARIGSSSAHFTSTVSSPCSTRKWAALEGGGGGPSPLGETSPRGAAAGGCGACPVVVGPPGCGEDEAPGAVGRGPPDGDCGGCAKAAVGSNAAATAKHTVECFNTVLS